MIEGCFELCDGLGPQLGERHAQRFREIQDQGALAAGIVDRGEPARDLEARLNAALGMAVDLERVALVVANHRDRHLDPGLSGLPGRDPPARLAARARSATAGASCASVLCRRDRRSSRRPRCAARDGRGMASWPSVVQPSRGTLLTRRRWQT